MASCLGAIFHCSLINDEIKFYEGNGALKRLVNSSFYTLKKLIVNTVKEKEIESIMKRWESESPALRQYVIKTIDWCQTLSSTLEEEELIITYYAFLALNTWIAMVIGFSLSDLELTAIFPMSTESEERVTDREKFRSDISLVLIFRKVPLFTS